MNVKSSARPNQKARGAWRAEVLSPISTLAQHFESVVVYLANKPAYADDVRGRSLSRRHNVEATKLCKSYYIQLDSSCTERKTLPATLVFTYVYAMHMSSHTMFPQVKFIPHYTLIIMYPMTNATTSIMLLCARSPAAPFSSP